MDAPRACLSVSFATPSSPPLPWCPYMWRWSISGSRPCLAITASTIRCRSEVGRHKAKEYHVGNIRTHDARRGPATEATPDRANLNVRLFIDTKDHGVGRRLEVETDVVGRLAAGKVADQPWSRHGLLM